MLNSCIKEPHSHLAVFVMQHNAEERAARLDFIQNMEYKFVELMSCQYGEFLTILGRVLTLLTD